MKSDDIIRRKLALKGIRPVDLAKELKVSGPQASNILNGSRGISPKHFEVIGRLLNAPTLSDLFTEPSESGTPHALPRDQGGGGNAQARLSERQALNVLIGAIRSAVNLLGEAVAKAAASGRQGRTPRPATSRGRTVRRSGDR